MPFITYTNIISLEILDITKYGTHPLRTNRTKIPKVRRKEIVTRMRERYRYGEMRLIM
jgi:hypothetical protein